MSKIDLQGFGGIAPKKHPKFLTQHEAQTADNCQLLSGALDSWRAPLFDVTLAKSGDIKTIYQMIDGTWLHWTEEVNVVRGPITTDTLERTYYSGTDKPRVTSNTMADIGGNNEFPESSYILGIPAPTSAPTASTVGTHTTPVDTAYVYCFVSGWGEEGPPSPVSNVVAADYSTGTVNITTMDFPTPSTDMNITHYRLYRIASGTQGAEYLFVADVAVNDSTPQYNDGINGEDLGEVMPSEDWYPPPTTLAGLTGMANGMMAGFVGNTVYFCEPFLPHAWPSKYAVNVDSDIVSLGSFGNSLVVMTKGYPYILTGIHPSAMAMAIHKVLQPCVNNRGTVQMMDGVVYRSPDGLYYIGSKGPRLVTRDYYSRQNWSLLHPDEGQAGYYDGRYIGFFDFTSRGIIFGPEDAKEGQLRELDFLATAVYSNPDGDRFYIGIQDPVTLATSIYEFNAGGSKLIYLWRSKLFTSGRDFTNTAGKIKGDYEITLSPTEYAVFVAEQAAIITANEALMAAGDLNGAINEYAINDQTINGDDLQDVPALPEITSFVIRYFVDNVVVHEENVTSDLPFRLPRVEGSDHYIEVTGRSPIYQVILASSIKDLASHDNK